MSGKGDEGQGGKSEEMFGQRLDCSRMFSLLLLLPKADPLPINLSWHLETLCRAV